MASYSRIDLIGNIGDVQPGRNPTTGKPYLRLSVAVDDEGAAENAPPTWYSCIISGRKAENIDRLLKVFRKGRLVRVSGRPRNKIFYKDDKSAHISHGVWCDELPTVLDPKPKDY